MVFETEKIYPDPRYRGQEGATIVTNSAIFDVLIQMNGLTPSETAALKSGQLRYGVYVEEAVPFLLLDFPSAKFNVDASFNFHAVMASDRTAWLEAEANAVTLIGIEGKNYKVVSIRLCGFDLDFVAAFKSAAAQQLVAYSNTVDVNRKINNITARLSTEQMMSKTKMYKL